MMLFRVYKWNKICRQGIEGYQLHTLPNIMGKSSPRTLLTKRLLVLLTGYGVSPMYLHRNYGQAILIVPR
jgi:hypothetical protein